MLNKLAKEEKSEKAQKIWKKKWAKTLSEPKQRKVSGELATVAAVAVVK